MDHGHQHEQGGGGGEIDPVCGMTVLPATAKHVAEHAGRRYYFCSAGCKAKFEADPRKYLEGGPVGMGDAEEKSAAAVGQWTCPMHPEVVRDGPGDCPLCGMPLERVGGSAGPEDDADLRAMTRLFWISAALSAPVLVIAMAEIGGQTWRLAQMALATPVVVWGGGPFFKRGWDSLVNRSLNMFTLIAVGVGTAYGYSVFATLFPDALPMEFMVHHGVHPGMAPVYFEAAAVIVTLVLLGQVLEGRARGKTGEAIRALLNLAPPTARRIDGAEEHDVPLEQVMVGDRLRVRPGEKVPVDGRVVEGSGAVDESTITGESMPVQKSKGAEVLAGTLNTTGGFVMEAKHVGGETVLARIVQLVAEAQRSRAPIQKLVDRVAAVFVPAVFAVAAAAAIAWGVWGPEPRMASALVAAVSVLIIACPCALGLATPMAIMVGVGRGARAGVLIRSAEAMQELRRVDTLVIDKTGTLTEGKPRLVTVLAVPGGDEEKLLRLAAAVERGSEHPIGAAIVAGAMERKATRAPVDKFESLAGQGVAAEVLGEKVTLGNARLMASRGVELGDLAAQAEQLRREGQTVVFMAIGVRAAGLLGVADPIKANAAEAVAGLHADGLRLVMLTGDGRATAEAVGKKLGLDAIESEMTPEQKHAYVMKLRTDGRVVAMAGDGVNDAPALAVAHVGIAMGTGTDVAMRSAGVTLVKGDLRGILRARKLSDAIMKNIGQNLVLAFGYNALAIPIAAGALYPAFGLLLSPMIASAAMSLSSVSVIANALRLRGTKL
jgi:Cu+-exporting ATPase